MSIISKDQLAKQIANPKLKVSKDELEKARANIAEMMALDRQKYLIPHPFIGSILMRMDLVPIRDLRCKTASTDGKSIFMNMSFYKQLTPKQRMFVLAHEVWHVAYMHFLRRQNRKQKLWNIATDCEINYMLKMDHFDPPDDLCWPEKGEENLSAEEIYERRIKNKQKENEAGRIPGGGSGGFSGQFDKHFDKDEFEKETEEGIPSEEVTDEWGEVGFDENYAPQIDADTAEKIREMVIAAAHTHERTKGSLPSNIASVVSKLMHPEISWREYLAQFITACYGCNRVWLPPNRRHVWAGNYMQSRRGERINVIVTIDTSGSTTADMPKFMTELCSLLTTFGNYDLTVVQCDSEVHALEKYSEYDPFPVDDIQHYKIKGGGGSSFIPAFKLLQKEEVEATCHVILTDGYIDFPDTNPLGIPTLVVLTKDGSDKTCPWGKVIRFKE